MIITTTPLVTDDDLAEIAFIDSLLRAPNALEILVELLDDEMAISAMMTFLRMTRIIVEACAARLARDECLSADEAFAKSLTLLHQWGPAPLVIAFGPPEATYPEDAFDWLKSHRLPDGSADVLRY